MAKKVSRVLEAFHPGLLADLLPQDRTAGEGTGIAKQALLVGLKEQGEDAFFFGTLQGGQERSGIWISLLYR